MTNSRFSTALSHGAQAVPPIWFMRQAGRYHSHYRALRKQHSFMDLCKDPELASEVALGPVADFDFDVAILFSDLLFPLEALGMGLSYGDGGPKLGWLLTSETLAKLDEPEAAAPKLLFQREALRRTRLKLPSGKSLIGFVGGPVTLFGYAVEERHGKGVVEMKKNLSLFEGFCEKLMPLLLTNIRLQLEGGAEVVMVFDTAAGELSPRLFKELVVPTLRTIVHTFPKRVGYYALGIQHPHLVDPIFHSDDLAGLGFDHRWDMREALSLRTSGFAQGNFDQALLHCSRDRLSALLEDYLRPLASLPPESRAGWVCGLGHGILPETPEENVRFFIAKVRETFA